MDIDYPPAPPLLRASHSRLFSTAFIEHCQQHCTTKASANGGHEPRGSVQRKLKLRFEPSRTSQLTGSWPRPEKRGDIIKRILYARSRPDRDPRCLCSHRGLVQLLITIFDRITAIIFRDVQLVAILVQYSRLHSILASRG